ncbi:glycosyltransferase family 2 protein [Flexivirga caeni]|uniref:Glycosyltransferase family 2 protein n=2 Tax=Flexivirga caeni TaxID=2294115 RepID=A0A3M9ML44_9MICO|nr:glycosyltransferase family 2 protein [Flexivirga caeni]
MVAYGPQPDLNEAVRSALASTGVAIQVVIVDNGAEPAAIEAVRTLDGVTVLSAGDNLGFGAGCNLGVQSTDAEVVVLLNCDAAVRPDTIRALVDAVSDPQVGIATASLRLADDPEVINSVGNPVHYLGLAWAGGYGEPADRHTEAGPVSSASGACCALTRAWWDELGGFDASYFAYHEDVELSIRTWQRGRTVVYVPGAVATHHYEFSRNPGKLYLLERNRLMTLLTTYSGRTLGLLAPALLGQEVGLLAMSASQGWLGKKLAGYGWLLRHRRQLLDRHRQLQAERSRPDREVMQRFTATLDPANVPVPGAITAVNALSTTYRKLVNLWL